MAKHQNLQVYDDARNKAMKLHGKYVAHQVGNFSGLFNLSQAENKIISKMHACMVAELSV